MVAITLASVVFPVPGGPQRMDRAEPVGFDQAAQRRLPGAEEVALADDVVERVRAHPEGERRGLRQPFVGRV